MGNDIRRIGRLEYRLRALRYQLLRYVLRTPYIVSSSAGTAQLYRNNPDNRGENSLLPLGTAVGTSGTVRTIALDDYLTGAGFGERSVRFIKLDIEGHEYEAIRGAACTLRRCQCLMLEYSPQFFARHGYSGTELLDLLFATGLHPHLFEGGAFVPSTREVLLAVQGQVNTIWLR